MRLMVMLVSFVSSTQLWAGELSRPTDEVLLTLSGDIGNANADGKTVFDTASLKKLGMVSFQTTSPWYNGRTILTDTPLQKFMDYIRANGSVVKATALNDYTAVIPLSNFKKYSAILALKINRKHMRIRDRGPLFIVYPYDSMLELDNQTYYLRSTWQIGSMDIE